MVCSDHKWTPQDLALFEEQQRTKKTGAEKGKRKVKEGPDEARTVSLVLKLLVVLLLSSAGRPVSICSSHAAAPVPGTHDHDHDSFPPLRVYHTCFCRRRRRRPPPPFLVPIPAQGTPAAVPPVYPAAGAGAAGRPSARVLFLQGVQGRPGLRRGRLHQGKIRQDSHKLSCHAACLPFCCHLSLSLSLSLLMASGTCCCVAVAVVLEAAGPRRCVQHLAGGQDRKPFVENA